MTFTAEEFRLALPDKMKKSINQALIDQVCSTISNPDEYETYRDNLLSYTRVLADGKFKIGQYLDAVKYVSFKLLGATNIEAFTKAFPDKMKYYSANNTSAKDIASYVSAYNKGKLVNLIMEQTLVPSWVLNQDLYQRAINQQAHLMMNAKSEKVQSDAANSLLTHLKPPEVAKVELDITAKDDGSINALRNTMMELVAQQRAALQAGVMDAQQVAHQKLGYMDVEAKEVP